MAFDWYVKPRIVIVNLLQSSTNMRDKLEMRTAVIRHIPKIIRYLSQSHNGSLWYNSVKRGFRLQSDRATYFVYDCLTWKHLRKTWNTV